MGVTKTLHLLTANFFFLSSMHLDVCNFVAQCLTCQQLTHETKRLVTLLQPLLIPSAIWEDLSLDFIIRLLPS